MKKLFFFAVFLRADFKFSGNMTLYTRKFKLTNKLRYYINLIHKGMIGFFIINL